jgi:hypothetical protein
MYINIKAFKVHKLGESFEGCHDNYMYNLDKKLFAIADGVSKSFFPALWSKQLVEKFDKDDSILDFNKKEETISLWLEDVRKAWMDEVNKNDWDSLPFYVKNRRSEAAFSTFIGLKIFSVEKNEEKWKAVIIGDSCLFHIRDGKIIAVHNMNSSKDFDNYPDSIASRNSITNNLPKDLCERIKLYEGEFKKNDSIVLGTDAVAKWILENKENKNFEDNHKLFGLMNMDEFDEFIYQAKKGKLKATMEDDDITLMQIKYSNEDIMPVELPMDWKSKYGKNSLPKIKPSVSIKPKRLEKLSEPIIDDNFEKFQQSLNLLKDAFKNEMMSSFSKLSEKIENVIKTSNHDREQNEENNDVLLKELDSLKKSIEKQQEYFSKELETINKEMKEELNDLGEKISNQFETVLQTTESKMINANDEVKKKISELREEFDTYQNTNLAKMDETVEQLSDANKKLQMDLGSVSEEIDKLQKKNLQMKWSIGILLFLMVSFFIFHFYGEMLVKQ